jgi:RNA polymerase sigma-70 factor (ECF subfamily)
MEALIQNNWKTLQRELRGFILKRVKDKAIADDLVQDVFLKVHGSIDKLKNTEKLTAWIYQITRNTVNDHFRKKSKHIVVDEIDWKSDSNDLNECVASCLRDLVHTLPEKYKEAFQLAELEDLSQLELSQRLGISYSGAKSRVQRARTMLKQKMDELLVVKTDSYGNVIVCEDRNPFCCEGC